MNVNPIVKLMGITEFFPKFDLKHHGCVLWLLFALNNHIDNFVRELVNRIFH